MADDIVITNETRDVLLDYTRQQLIDSTRQMNRYLRKIKVLKRELAQEKARAQKQIKARRDGIDEIKDMLATKFENVDVTVTRNNTQQTILVVRDDTQEVLEDRPLRDDEIE